MRPVAIVRAVSIPVPAPSFDAHYGLVLDEVGDGLVRAHVDVRPEVTQALGLVHGGVYCSVAEGITSMATYQAVHGRGDVAMGIANQTSFLRPVTSGTVHAVAEAIHRGRTTWVWDVRFTDDEHRLCAVSRMTVAVRPAPERPPAAG